jgi:hypothetical protein
MPGDARLLREMAFGVCMALQTNQIWGPHDALEALTPIRNSADSAPPQLRFTEACLGTLHLRQATSGFVCTSPGPELANGRGLGHPNYPFRHTLAMPRSLFQNNRLMAAFGG